MKQPTLTCLSIDCPERKSLCCGAISKNVKNKFVCSKCGKPYKGGKCNAAQKYVLCWACHKPIHISEFGGVMSINGEPAFIHNNIVCLIKATDAQKKEKGKIKT